MNPRREIVLYLNPLYLRHSSLYIMAKVLRKYFIAIVPEGALQEKATDIKLVLKEKYNLKYALRSPAHVTLKMPFLWNEAKEERLFSALEPFFATQSSFDLSFQGIGKFSDRVIYIKVKKNGLLLELQKELALVCQRQLNQKQELSDYAYHPHMTVAFKDVRRKCFADYLEAVKAIGFSGKMSVEKVALLKKLEGEPWKIIKSFPLG